MKITDFQHLDALILRLAQLGYIKTDVSETPPQQPHWEPYAWQCKACRTIHNGITIDPGLDFDGETTYRDLSFWVSATAEGEIIKWQLIEGFGGNYLPIENPESVELDGLSQFLIETVQSWQREEA